MRFWNRFRKKSIQFINRSARDLFFSARNSIVSFNFNFQTTSEIIFAYYNVPQLAAVINYSARVFSDGKPKIEKILSEDQKEIITLHPFLELLNNPHPLYSEGEFLQTLYKQWSLFGAVYIYKAIPVAFSEPTGLFILPGQNVKIKPKDNLKAVDILNARNINEIIDKYILSYNNSQLEIEPEDIMMLTTTSLRLENNEFLLPDSPVTSIKQPINNILSQYKARNTIVDKRGALGVLSNNDIGPAGTIPLDPDEKEDVQNQYKRYGLTGQDFQILITNANLKWQSMSMPIKDLQLLEGIQEDKIAVCDAFQFPIHLLNSLKASTLNNMQVADKQLYTKKMILDNNIISKALSREFLPKDEQLFFDVSHVDVLQEDRELNVEISEKEIKIVIDLNRSVSEGQMTKENAVNTLLILTEINEEDANLIINEDFTEEINLETDLVPGVSQEQLEAQANLRGSVGGVQGILAIQSSVAEGTTDISAAIATLIEIYGFTTEVAVAILGTPINTQENE